MRKEGVATSPTLKASLGHLGLTKTSAHNPSMAFTALQMEPTPQPSSGGSTPSFPDTL